MKKFIANVGLLSLLLSLVTTAHGVEEPFLGIGYSVDTFETDVPDTDNLEFEFDGTRLTLGSKLTDYFGVETRFILPGHGDNDGGIRLNPSYIASVLANIHLPLGPLFLYLNGGYSVAEIELEDLDLTFDEESLSYGGGISFELTNKLAVYADITSYITKKDEFTFNSASAGIRFLIY